MGQTDAILLYGEGSLAVMVGRDKDELPEAGKRSSTDINGAEATQGIKQNGISSISMTDPWPCVCMCVRVCANRSRGTTGIIGTIGMIGGQWADMVWVATAHLPKRNKGKTQGRTGASAKDEQFCGARGHVSRDLGIYCWDSEMATAGDSLRRCARGSELHHRRGRPATSNKLTKIKQTAEFLPATGLASQAPQPDWPGAGSHGTVRR